MILINRKRLIDWQGSLYCKRRAFILLTYHNYLKSKRSGYELQGIYDFDYTKRNFPEAWSRWHNRYINKNSYIECYDDKVVVLVLSLDKWGNVEK